MESKDKIRELEERIERLEAKSEENSSKYEKYVTPKQLAKLMQCSTNHIYLQIRAGHIKVINQLGTSYRIPLSQFDAETSKGKSMDNINRAKRKDKEIIKENKPTTTEEIRKYIWS
jgi:excisionase family DNA binding protein